MLPYLAATDCAAGKGEYESSESLTGTFAANRVLDDGSSYTCLNYKVRKMAPLRKDHTIERKVILFGYL